MGEGTGEDTEVTMPDPMDMVTMERDLLMKLPLPSLAPTPTLKLTPGTGTMGMLTGLTDMVITVADMEAMEAITTERDNTYPDGLGKKVLGDALEIVTFPDMKHGWSVRGDMSDPKVERDVQKCFNLALAFFKKIH